MSRDIESEIRSEIGENKIVLYMKGLPDEPRCGFSAAAADVLRQLNVPFLAVNVLADEQKWHGIKAFSDWPTIPQLYVDGEFVGGCDIMREMHAKGELQPIVDKALAGELEQG